MWFLFGEFSSSSGCLGWAKLFYCGTPWAFHIIILPLLQLLRSHTSGKFINEHFKGFIHVSAIDMSVQILGGEWAF